MDKIDLPYTELEFYDRYVIGRTRDGVNMSIDKHREVMEIIEQKLSTPFGMIIDEVNKYSIDLPVFMSIRDEPSISCIGVVCYRKSTKIALSFGQSLIKKPVFFSDNLQEVKQWMDAQTHSNSTLA